jgi:hypothetical protein
MYMYMTLTLLTPIDPSPPTSNVGHEPTCTLHVHASNIERNRLYLKQHDIRVMCKPLLKALPLCMDISCIA